MHLIENYSLLAGLEIDKPFINEKFFPLEVPYEKAILLHGFAGAINNNQASFPSKIYDYMAEVISVLHPIVSKYGYKIYQIGLNGEPLINGIDHLNGKTSIHQTAFLLKNCALLICNDSINSHIRSSYGKPMITVFGPTSVREHGPFWKNEKTRTLVSHRFGNKLPSFSSFEFPKTINVIPPEDIVNHALDLLGLEEKYNTKTLCIGDLYNNLTVEALPSCDYQNINGNANFIVRMDYLFNEEMLQQIALRRKISIVSDKPINLDILKSVKPNISQVSFEVDKIDPEYIKEIRRAGIPFACFSKNESKLNDLRFKFYDICHVEVMKEKTKEDFYSLAKKYLNKELGKDFEIAKMKFKTNKFIFDDKKIYLSRAHQNEGVFVDHVSKNTANIIDNETFWKEVNSFYFFTEIDESETKNQ